MSHATPHESEPIGAVNAGMRGGDRAPQLWHEVCASGMSSFLTQLATSATLPGPLVRQADIDPAGEQVEIPVALAVAATPGCRCCGRVSHSHALLIVDQAAISSVRCAAHSYRAADSEGRCPMGAAYRWSVIGCDIGRAARGDVTRHATATPISSRQPARIKSNQQLELRRMAVAAR